MQKSNNCLEKRDIISIQECDQDLSEIIRKLKNEQKVNDKFVLREGILFKQNLVYGTQVYLLCLPENLSREILFVMHTNNSSHMNLVNLRLNFQDNFWCKNLESLLQSVKNSCLFCRLNQARRQVRVKGTQRRHHDEVTPGASWQADILYLSPSSAGHRFTLTLTKILSSYVCAIPLKTLNVSNIRSAMENFLSVMPQMREIGTRPWFVRLQYRIYGAARIF